MLWRVVSCGNRDQGWGRTKLDLGIDAMFRLSWPDRTVFGPGGGRLVAGWTEESKKRRQAEFDAGRKIDYRIEELEVRVFGNTAITTFYRIGTVKELNEAAKPSHLRISGVWVRQADGCRNLLRV